MRVTGRDRLTALSVVVAIGAGWFLWWVGAILALVALVAFVTRPSRPIPYVRTGSGDLETRLDWYRNPPHTPPEGS